MRTLMIGTLVILMQFTPSLRSYCQENYIIAGNTEGVLYTDIQDTLIASNGNLGEFLYEIDINMDNEMDFVITVFYEMGVSHEFRQVSITPYGNNKVAFRDSVAGWNGTSAFYINRAKGVNANDTINSNIQFVNDKVYLMNKGYAVLGYYIDLYWGDYEFIPVCLVTANNESCFYGWIKVTCTITIWAEITIESFAVDILGSISNQVIDKEKILVYPNPFNDKISIVLKSNFKMIEIFDLTGKCHFKGTINQRDKTAIIDLRKLENGIYILKIKTEDQDITKKINKI